jgi:hypothetical protein
MADNEHEPAHEHEVAPRRETTPEATPEPVAVPEHSPVDELRSTVASLTETVAGVISRLDAMTQSSADETPTGVPWTHRRLS